MKGNAGRLIRRRPVWLLGGDRDEHQSSSPL